MKILEKLTKCIKRDNPKFENFEMMIMATIIGMITGTVAIIFNKSLDVFSTLVFSIPSLLYNFTTKENFIIVPIIGGILLGIINKYYIPSDKSDFGVSQVMEELKEINHFLMKPKIVLAKTIGTIVTLGCGLSAGRQGPIVHLGGAIGSNIGYRFGYNKKKISILIGCGVSGSIAGVFNTPIAAALFVLEILMNKEHLKYFSPIVISSLTSIITTRLLIGDISFLAVRGDFGILGYKELINYLLLGVIIGIVAVVYIRLIHIVKKIFEKIHLQRMYLPIIGAMIVAILGYIQPLVFDIHHESILMILQNNLSIKVLVILIVCKMLATAVTLGSGGFGGVFMPGLYIGSIGGSIFGNIISLIFNGQIYNIQSYSLIGMAAMFSGFSNAPITATIMLLELTKNYSVILPVLLAATVSSATANLIYEKNVYSKNR